LNLKEMNLLLLKKVEELTLHLIELKKENEGSKAANEVLKSLSSDFDAFRKQVEELEKRLEKK
jgi:hypothetical protein